MRAVTLERGELSTIELPIPEPGPGEVLVKSIACGICGSDLHAAKHTEDFVKTSREAGGAFKLTTFDPVILGHEFCAEVIDFGPKTSRSVGTGTLVCSPPVLLRDTSQTLGYSPDFPGGFAEYMLLSEPMLNPVPKGLSAELASMTEPMAVGYHAMNMARLEGNEAIVVIGCGPVGLAVITALKQKHQGPIIASDYSPGRRALAEQIGAHEVIDPAVESAFSNSAFKARKEHVVFECVGVPGMIDQIYLETPANSRIVVVGVCLQQDFSRPLIAINKELNLQFVLGWSMEEFVESLNFIADGTFDVAPLITSEAGLDDVAGAFERLASPNQEAKVIVKPWA